MQNDTPVPLDDDPMLQMWGLGRELWADVKADEYVESLRAEWEKEEQSND